MAYLGNVPAQSYTSYSKQDFTTSATTSYTLDYPVANENEIALFINFVRQEPTTAYTASGTTLTLTSATSATDDMYCVFLGKALQTVNPPAGSVDSSKINYPLTTFSSTGIDDNATSTAITIDSSQNVGIGTTSPTDTNSFGTALDIQGSPGGAVYVGSSGDRGIFGYAASEQYIINPSASGTIRFTINSSERMRINNSGSLLVGKTSVGDVGTVGSEINWGGGGALFTQNNNSVVQVNRKTSDGDLIIFRQDGTVEGSISVSGTTVSYSGFTGTHWSRFIDNSTPNILRGTVLESLDEMCDWYNLEFDVTDEEGNTNTKKIPHVLADGQSVGDVITYDWNTEKKDEDDNDIIKQVQATIVKEADIKHMKAKVSDTVDAKNVYGVFNAYDEDGEGYNDFIVASVGSFVVRIKAGETVAKGDLLQSNGDGTAKVQTDDNVKSSSFAKVLSTTIIETYEDGSFIVPCSLMC